ncbi:zf-TFIIB domain-containing protein [bacterium]|nr:zf-TFIIB domain-containing protein [candidate division CSSED10-310 bacterium]
MIVIEYNNIELDYCSMCWGIWFDAGEIELLLREIGISEDNQEVDLPETEVSVSEARRPCPVCDKMMVKVKVPGGTVLIDKCPFNDGFWFDAGEISIAISEIFTNISEEELTVKALADFLGKALSKNSEENNSPERNTHRQ